MDPEELVATFEQEEEAERRGYPHPWCCLWKPRNSPVIPIWEMTPNHVRNTIRWIERAQETIAEAGFPMFQGEMAQMTAEHDWEAAQDWAYAVEFVKENLVYQARSFST